MKTSLRKTTDRGSRADAVQRERGEVVDFLVGKRVECARQDGSGRKGMIIHQVKVKPSICFIKFDDDFYIYVYDLVKAF
ncbi:hypothetical protein AB1E18_007355 [Capra hircus]